MTKENHKNYLWIYHSCWYRNNKRMTNKPPYAANPAPSIRLTCCHQRPKPQMYLSKTNRPMQGELI